MVANPLSPSNSQTSPFLSPPASAGNDPSPLSTSDSDTIRPYRPTPLPVRSSLLPPPTNPALIIAPSTRRPSSLAGSTRPYSPPNMVNHPTKRYPSPPTVRPRSVMTAATGRRPSSAPSQPHPQHSLTTFKAVVPAPAELESFARLCHELYYEKSSRAAMDVDRILKGLPHSSKTAYARTMAQVRAGFHRDEAIKQRSLVETLLDETSPGAQVRASLEISEGGVVAMRSKLARTSRAEALKLFLATRASLPGTLPFLRSLYAVLYLQALEPRKGGAGKRRVEWEVDVAVFSEAAGGEWARESIQILKAVLGFTETIKDPPPESYFEDEDDDGAAATSRSLRGATSSPGTVEEGQALYTGHKSNGDRAPPKIPPHRTKVISSPPLSPSSSPPAVLDDDSRGSVRARAGSDPFVDPGDKEKRSASRAIPHNPLSSPALSSTDEETVYGTPFSTLSSSPPTPVSPNPPRGLNFFNVSGSTSPAIGTPSPAIEEELLLPQYRIFTVASYLTDPELDALSRLFPNHITSRSTPSAQKGGLRKSGSDTQFDASRDIEEGGLSATTGKLVSIGHGEIKIGSEFRDGGFPGTRWQRFTFWWRKAFRRN